MRNVSVRQRRPYIHSLANAVSPEHAQSKRPVVALLLLDHALVVQGIELFYPERTDIETHARFEISHPPSRLLATGARRDRGNHPRLIGIAPEPGLRLVNLRSHATIYVEPRGRERHPSALVALITGGNEGVGMPDVTVEAKIPVRAQQCGVPCNPRVAAWNRNAGPVPEAGTALQQPLPSTGLDRMSNGPAEDHTPVVVQRRTKGGGRRHVQTFDPARHIDRHDSGQNIRTVQDRRESS